jgi:phosphatidylserine/phosphatidylglycerophosphate/cardiolipin synthase-like enzyme
MPEQGKVALMAMKKEFQYAKRSIRVSIYSFTNKSLAKSLKNAAKRGVKVEIIFDKKESKSKRGKSVIGYLAKYKNITVYRLSGLRPKRKKYSGIMHIKMALIDDKTLIFGSANWTYRAFSNNYETLFITKDYALAKKFDKFFKLQKSRAKLYR